MYVLEKKDTLTIKFIKEHLISIYLNQLDSKLLFSTSFWSYLCIEEDNKVPIRDIIFQKQVLHWRPMNRVNLFKNPEPHFQELMGLYNKFYRTSYQTVNNKVISCPCIKID